MSNDNQWRVMGFQAESQEFNTKAMEVTNGKAPKDPPLVEVYATDDQQEAIRLLKGGFFTKEQPGDQEDKVFIVREVLAPRDADLSDIPRHDPEHEAAKKAVRKAPIRKDS